MKAKPQFSKLTAYVPGKAKGGIKLSANENPFGHSPKVNEALAGMTDFSKYPDGGSYDLKAKVAQFFEVSPKQLIFGAGADEVIQMISRTYLSPGDNIIQANPTFSQYEHHAIIEGADVLNIPVTKTGDHDLGAMIAAIDDNTKIVWVCNPNNPTGTYIPQDKLQGFLAKIPAHILVVVDEAYAEYATATDFPDTVKLLKQYPNLIILRTFSKIYGLAALRVGYGIGSEEVMATLDVGRLPFNVSTVGQLAAMVALEDREFTAACVQKNALGLKQYTDFLDSRGVTYHHSQANFIFLPTEQAKTIGQQLEAAGYIIRVFRDGIRITIGTEADNAAIIDVLGNIL